MTKKPVEQRFWEKVKKQNRGCWIWAGYFQKNEFGGIGYGRFWYMGRPHLAHRVCRIITHGSIPDGKKVLHHCDNPLCVKPKHLFVGTHQDNTDDMMKKGRRADTHGMNHPMVRLTDSDVRKIKRLLLSGEMVAKDIGAIFGVGKSNINKIRSGKLWSHIVI